jgi:GAF domain-containing protein
VANLKSESNLDAMANPQTMSGPQTQMEKSKKKQRQKRRPGTPRDAAFCAHVVYSREPMIVPDAFQDVRFADNPVVINEPRITFLCRLSIDA